MSIVNINDPSIKTVFINAKGIQWNTEDDSLDDDAEELCDDLPTEVQNIPFDAGYLRECFSELLDSDSHADIDNIIDELTVEYLTDTYGYCIFGIDEISLSKVNKWNQNSISA